MKRKAVVAVILLFMLVLNASLFKRLFSASNEYSISQGEVTIYALRAVKNRYLNKSKIKASELLVEGLEAINDQLNEILIKYDPDKRCVAIQIYNKKFKAEALRIRDIYDVTYILKQVYGFIEKNYKPVYPMKMTDIEYIAVNGILRKLDPHSYIFTPKDFEEFTDSTGGKFGGLGIVISTNDDGEIVVVSPINDTPAMKAGVESNDVIVQIDDESAVNMTLNQAVDRMRGDPGTDVTIMVRREGVPDLIKFTITRAEIKIESVIPAMPQPGIGYIKLTGFMENTYPAMLKALDDLKKDGMKALILDMRNNSGGLLSQAIKISDLFLQRGVIVSTVGEDEREVNEAKREDSDILDIPIVVMINAGTASAAEIVTAALKKNGRATVFGRKSFGKGSVQNLFRIPGGGGIKLTIAQYLTPGNISIQSVGITPDVELQPAFIHEKKISIFDTDDDVLKEADLKEHIVSEYIPKKKEKPVLTIRYHKPYKDVEQLIKERKKEKVGVYKSDEEIEIVIKALQQTFGGKKNTISAAQDIKDLEWNQIVAKLQEIGVPWKKLMKLGNVDAESVKAKLISSSKLEGGKVNKLEFEAEYPETIENLIGILETDIPYLRRVEIPFGTFKGKVTRSVSIKLPESIPWMKSKGRLKLYAGKPDKAFKTEEIFVETIPVKRPDLVFSMFAVEHKGGRNGVVEPDEEISLHINMKNVGKGALLDGRAMIINNNNSKELFIENGTMPVEIKPGEEKEGVFTFKTSSITQKQLEEIKLTFTIYDYKTKYSAGFSVPIKKGAVICKFREDKKMYAVPENTMLFASVEGKEGVLKVLNDSVAGSQGICGEMVLLENGLWAKELKPADKKADLKKTEKQYSIKMPSVKFDASPVIDEDGKLSVSFEASPDNVRDVFLYVNDSKIYYKRLDGRSPLKDTVKITLEDKVNDISFVAKGSDSEKSILLRKVAIFPKGKDQK